MLDESFLCCLEVSNGGFQDGGSLELVVPGWVVLGEVICCVVLAWAPIDVVVTLADAVLDPVEPHIDGAGSFLLGDAGRYRGCCLVVCFDGRGGLLVSHFFEGSAEAGAFLPVFE